MQGLCCAVGLAIVLVSTSVLAVPTAPLAPRGSPVEIELNLFRTAFERFQTKDYEAADALFQRVVDAPAFADLEPLQQHAVLQLAGIVAGVRNDLPRAGALLKRSLSMPMADDGDAYYLLETSYRLHDYPTAVACATRLAEQWPRRLDDVRPAALYRLSDEAQRIPDHEARFRLLKALQAMHWKGEDGREPAALWRDLVQMMIERGDLAGGERVALSIDDAGVLLSMRADKRFDRVVAAHRSHFNVADALAREITSIEADIAARPRQLVLRVQLTYRLLRSGRFDDVVRLADEVRANIEAQTAGSTAYDDQADDLPWILDSKARALQALGKTDLALEALEDAARASSDEERISHAINLALFQVDFDQPDAALASIEGVGGASPYGQMMVQLVRYAAALQRADSVLAEASRRYLVEHVSDAPLALFSALCLQDQLDPIAAELIARLADPDTRSSMLEMIQTYRVGARTARSVAFHERIRSVLQRDDVRAAIDPIGRVERFDIFEPIS